MAFRDKAYSKSTLNTKKKTKQSHSQISLKTIRNFDSRRPFWVNTARLFPRIFRWSIEQTNAASENFVFAIFRYWIRHSIWLPSINNSPRVRVAGILFYVLLSANGRGCQQVGRAVRVPTDKTVCVDCGSDISTECYLSVCKWWTFCEKNRLKCLYGRFVLVVLRGML